MSTARRDRPLRRTLCDMVQLHCWLPRTMDSVVMPFHPLAILTSTLAAKGISLAVHLADAATKGAAGKESTPSNTAPSTKLFATHLASSLASGVGNLLAPGGATAATDVKGIPAKSASKDKPASDSDPQANPLTASLAAAMAGSLPAAPLTSPLTPKPSAPTGQVVPKATASVPVAPAVVSGTRTPAVALPTAAKPGLPTARPTAVKMPTPPATTVRNTPTASGHVPVHATPDSLQAARAATQAKSSEATLVNAPAKPLSGEGKGEIHLGTHATIEPLKPETATSEHAQATQGTMDRTSVLQPSGATAPEIPPSSEASHTASTQAATVVAHETLLKPSAEVATVNGAASRLFGVSPPGSKWVSSADEATSPRLPSPAPTKQDQTPPPTTANPSAPPDSSVPASLAVSSPAPVSQPGHSATPALPVTDQLTRAFLAQADVVQREGKTDFHLRLDPPQLGSVQIHLTATDHTVSARIVVAQEGTRQLLEDQAHQLRQGLAQAGLSLGSFDVTRDGGGSHGGGHQAAPETPFSLPTPTLMPRTSGRVSTIVSRPMDGINILA